MALLVIVVVALLTVPWAAAAVLPVWALVVAADTVERRGALPTAATAGRLAEPPRAAVAPALAARV